MKIRIKFKKWGSMKFIGHLDMMRYFQKAMRRAGIAIAYSEGYSPHQIMSFAAPLGVGITSDGEYLDIEVTQTTDSMQSMAALNAVMVEGIEITEYVKLPDKAKTAMSIVTAADYAMFYKAGYEIAGTTASLREAVRAFYEEPEEILVTKKTKKSERELDIKKLVYAFEVRETEAHVPYFYLNVSTGSTDNIKPELVLEAFYKHLGIAYEPMAFQIHRYDVYTNASDSDVRIPLGKQGEQVV